MKIISKNGTWQHTQSIEFFAPSQVIISFCEDDDAIFQCQLDDTTLKYIIEYLNVKKHTKGWFYRFFRKYDPRRID